MTYNKPTIVAVNSALVAVQSQLKPQSGLADSVFGPGITANAYEADE